VKTSYTLSIDESGYSDPKTYKNSPVFVLSGCIVDDRNVASFREHFNQIKFATWKEKWPGVLMRSFNIGLGRGVFIELYDFDKNGKRNPNIKMSIFCRDLRRFYKRNYFKLIICLIDKEKAVKTKTITLNKGKKKMKYIWSQELVYRLTYRNLLKNFLCFLVARDSSGKILAEASSDQQDIILYKEFFGLQSMGIPKLDISHDEVKKRITSLSFVTKHNKDPEEEIADAMGYAARLTFELKRKTRKEEDLNVYEKMIVQAFNRNLLNIATNRKDKRLKKISKIINSFTMIPS